MEPAHQILSAAGIPCIENAGGDIDEVTGMRCSIFEGNLFYRKGEPAESNAQIVARSVRIARELGNEPTKPDETREMLGLKPL